MVSLLYEKDGGFSSIIFCLEICFLLPSVSFSTAFFLFTSNRVCYYQFLYFQVVSVCTLLSLFLLLAVSVYSCLLSTLLAYMEDLSTRWKKLSLSESEENRLALRIDRRKRDFLLAGKFFTCRSLNIEVVAKTFRPLWRTKGGFNVTVGGENILLFAFELEVDAERVIQGEPWAFDRHLVVFEKFDDYAPIHTLGFKSTAFWVQIHNLPFPLQTVEKAFSIGETIGPVIKPKDLGEMLGPNFMRVSGCCVSKPLCRGRKIYWDKDEGWTAFM